MNLLRANSPDTFQLVLTVSLQLCAEFRSCCIFDRLDGMLAARPVCAELRCAPHSAALSGSNYQHLAVVQQAFSTGPFASS